MFEITKDFNWKLREKRAKQRLSIKDASNEIGISRITLSKIESGKSKEVRKSVYVKLANWIVSED
ncbi:helix-turn-helix domain-containing protein [Enterococcus sp. AZ102]|uniref:helix-turn-helix domain-containing protein n=1 Tax=Enterococcus sp. AZ102 TaxID=2774865 RepID=UPI003F238B72